MTVVDLMMSLVVSKPVTLLSVMLVSIKGLVEVLGKRGSKEGEEEESSSDDC